MVSTRGFRSKFVEDEKVLCYEPDPTKAKVLYESKILEICTSKDSYGRKRMEYLVHFQGWNASWDRCVGEDFVLKDNEDNRQLQKELSEKAHELFLQHTQEKRKRRRLQQESVRSSLDTSSVSGGTDIGSVSSEQDVSDTDDDPEEWIKLELPEILKKKLEDDYHLINRKNKLVSLPCCPNVILILEDYVRHYANSQLNMATSTGKNKQPKPDEEKFRTNVSLCKEIADSLRVYFDYTVEGLLLYDCEQQQFSRCHRLCPLIIKKEIVEEEEEEKEIITNPIPVETIVKKETELTVNSPKSSCHHQRASARQMVEETVEPPVKRVLRSHGAAPPTSADLSPPTSTSVVTSTSSSSPVKGGEEGRVTRGRVLRDTLQQEPAHTPDTTPVTTVKHKRIQQHLPVSTDGPSSGRSTPTTTATETSYQQTAVAPELPRQLLGEVSRWKLLPDSLYSQNVAPPSLIYGVIHLTRLFVRLPEMLRKTNIPAKKVKTILHHLELLLDYLQTQKDLYKDVIYCDNYNMK